MAINATSDWITIDVTGSSFVNDITSWEADDWMNENIGEIIQDDPSMSYGNNWILTCELDIAERQYKWLLKLKHERDATLFLLRWS